MLSITITYNFSMKSKKTEHLKPFILMIRKKTFLFIISLLFSSISLMAQDTLMLDQIVATVGNNPIFYSDIQNQYLQMQARGTQFQGDPQCQIFEDLLIQKLLLNQSQVDSIDVGDKEVDNELSQRLDYFIKQIGSIEKLEEYFKKKMPEIKEDFRDIIRDQMLTQKMQSKITADIKMTPNEVHNYFKTLPTDSLPIIDAEYELAQIVAYPVFKEEEKAALKRKLEEMRERILKGGNFAAMARLYSEDPGSATKGGELGLMARSELVPEFAIAAFNLQPGEISEVVETDFGYHIIQLIEKRGERANMRHILLIPKVSFDAKSKAKAKLDSIANLIRKNTVKFDEAALKYSEDDNTKKNGGLMINPQTGSGKFAGSQIDAGTNYVIKNMNIGEVSNPFETVDDKGKQIYKVVMLKGKTKPHTANMKDDYQKIHDMAMGYKRMTVMNNWIIEKQKSSYIRIDNSFKNCQFNFKGWNK